MHAAQLVQDGLETVELVLKPQLMALDAEGVYVTVTEYTFAYVGSLVLVQLPQPVSLAQMKTVVDRVFHEEKYRQSVEIAYQVVQMSNDFFEKAGKLIPTAKADLAAFEGTYLVRLTKRINESLLLRAKEGRNFDPRTAPPFDYVNV